MRGAVVNRLSRLLGRSSAVDESLVQAAMERVEAGYSLGAATGLSFFHDVELETPIHSVLTPRADSEALLTAADRLVPFEEVRSVVDLGTGSGALLTAFLKMRPSLERALGIDVSADAVQVALRNVRRNSVQARVVQRDWTLACEEAPFDLGFWNPPYVESSLVADLVDPRVALDGGADGLDCYRAAPWHYVRRGGYLVAEVGWRQAAAVRTLLERSGGIFVGSEWDLGQVERALVFRRL